MQNNKVLNYTLLHQLGVGGMAEVWYAENEIGKKAAVKVLLPKFCADEAIVARFQNEAKVMVQLDHPNIRQAYDYTTVDGRPCMVMEYLEGDDLSTRMKRGERFTDEQLKKWWNQIADALNYTHAEGIVHRDLKPSNIFVDKKGNVKLLDFGIAKIKESISMTRTGTMMGTLMYMSPEQVMDTKHIDAATDRYSIAVTFVHLLTGKAPYDTTTSNDFEIRENIVRHELDMSGIPAEWQNFLRPYLAKNPKERPALRAFDAAGAAPSGFVPPVVPEPPASPAPASEETVVGGGANVEGTSVAEEDGTVVSQTSNPQSAGQKSASQKPKKKRKGLIVGIIVVLLLGGGVALALLLGGRGSHQSYESEEPAMDYGEVEAPAPAVELVAETVETPAVAESKPVPAGYVDLGLSVYWKSSNESGYYTYDEAVKRFGNSLPTKAQLDELENKCTWTWSDSKKGYDVKGPNGSSIFLPAAGGRDCNGIVEGEGSDGIYWSSTSYRYSTPDGLQYDAWDLNFYSGGYCVLFGNCCYGMSVRLVQGK